MFEFLTRIRLDGQDAKAAYDCSSSTSYITTSCLKSMGLHNSVRQAVLISVDTSSGPFTCPVNLLYHPGTLNLDIVLGRDWFNHCTTAIEDARISLADGRRLIFNVSPFHAVFTESELIGECTIRFIFYLLLKVLFYLEIPIVLPITTPMSLALVPTLKMT